MEAKETVMSDEQISEVGDKWRHTRMEIDSWLRRWDKFLCEAQAEISFKAGIKEVVEWLETEKSLLLLLTNHIGWNVWQAKLKEWGCK